mgnify:CR=1 FL=1
MTTKKKATPKKPAAKKTVAKKPVVKPNESEQKIIDQVGKLLADGYSVKMNCADRHKMCKPGEDLLAYIQANNPYELVGMKSGTAAVCFGIK